MMRWIRRALRRVFYWVWGQELGGVRSASTQAVGFAQSAFDEVKRLRGQLSALQALDVDLHHYGHAVIITRVGGADRVKIVDIASDLTVAQYRDLITGLERDFGARLSHVDGPHTIPRELFFTGEGR